MIPRSTTEHHSSDSTDSHETVTREREVGVFSSRTRSLIVAFFFLSGAVSLLYQVAWVRSLSLFFGSDIYSAATTLSVFMGGLALGSWLASSCADRLARPLVAYGMCEILTSLAALAVPYLLTAFHDTYKNIYVGSFETSPWLYHAFRAAVAVAALLVPTTLMGATLPLLVRSFVQEINQLGREAGGLYATNTLGALCGTLTAGFVLLPTLGVARSVTLMAALGVTIGLISVILGFGAVVQPSSGRPGAAASRGAEEHRSDRRRVLLVVALSGMAALALEVVWMRILIQSFSATVYGFSIMLACFLLGIYYGSARTAAAVDGGVEPLQRLADLQLGLSVAVAALAVVAFFVPKVFGTLVWGLTAVSGGFAGASVIAQFVIASVLILGPTIMLGAMFPYGVRAVTDRVEQRAEGTGSVYAANTIGAVLGSMLAAFVLLPAMGTRGALLVIALMFAVSGVIVQGGALRRSQWCLLVGGTVAGIVALALPRQTVVNYGLQRSTRPASIYHGDGVSNTVDIVRNDRGDTVMMINGNVEADTSFIQRRHFILKAYLPLLLHAQPRDVAVVGLGLGITLAATARYPGVETIRVIELSPDMVAAHRSLTELTNDILHNPKVRLRIDDGRNFMAMTDERFDIITADPVHPRITGAGYLYTREYYEAIRARLRPNGVVTQWMPMYNVSPRSFDVAFRTFAAVFPNATFWYVRGHGLFVATQQPTAISCRSLAANFDVPAVKADFASIAIESPAEFLGYLLMDREHVAAYLERTVARDINTDDNAFLEYRTPFEFLGRTDAIVPDLIRHAGWSEKHVLADDCAPQMRQAARGFFTHRLEHIVPELKEPIR